MKHETNGWLAMLTRSLLSFALLAAAGQMLSCEVDSYFDPSKTGRFMNTPTTIPILDRIDLIEEPDDPWGETTSVMPEDLKPSDLTYRLSPGDFVSIEIYEAFAPDQWRAYTRRIDATGMVRVPQVGDIPAAGKTQQELEDLITEELSEFIVDPHVNVLIEEGSAFTYTIRGFVANEGLFTLRRADLRLSEALAAVGGVPRSAQRIYVVRQVPLTEDVKRLYEQGVEPEPRSRQDESEPVDIESLIEELEDEDESATSPGMLDENRQPTRLVDVDDLEPAQSQDRPAVDVDELRDGRRMHEQGGETFIYVEERGEWVRARTPLAQPEQGDAEADGERPTLIMQRVIEIPFERIRVGDSAYDLVVRPNDQIIIEGPPSGNVYISGEIARPGVFTLPAEGRLTLSRLVAAAGDLGAVAVPERVDLTRRVGSNREATVRLDLAAIRRRTEPDVFLKPDDHVIIGTSWIATPLAVIRNGFRATYGFGFLLDRNFGNDVFGAPPTNRLQ